MSHEHSFTIIYMHGLRIPPNSFLYSWTFLEKEAASSEPFKQNLPKPIGERNLEALGVQHLNEMWENE